LPLPAKGGRANAIWLSGPTGMQPGMTPRLRVISRFFIALLPANKKRRRMARQGGAEGQQDRAIGRRSHDNIGSLAGTQVVNPTELHWFPRGEQPWRQLQCAPLDSVPHLFFAWGMTLLIRKLSAQARIEGWDPSNRSDDDYAVARSFRQPVESHARQVPAAPRGTHQATRWKFEAQRHESLGMI
jgi:hypothetical protein